MFCCLVNLKPRSSSLVILYETSWNFVIMYGYESYSSDRNMEMK
jgi:hypothetical protein